MQTYYSIETYNMLPQPGVPRRPAAAPSHRAPGGGLVYVYIYIYIYVYVYIYIYVCIFVYFYVCMYIYIYIYIYILQAPPPRSSFASQGGALAVGALGLAAARGLRTR